MWHTMTATESAVQITGKEENDEWHSLEKKRDDDYKKETELHSLVHLPLVGWSIGTSFTSSMLKF